MDSSIIYKALRGKYFDQKYILQNSYVFNWESDFFFMTTSKLFVEIEVKISRADFLADFKKLEKHEALSRTFKGLKTTLKKEASNFEVSYDEMKTVRPREYCEVIKGYKQELTGRILKTNYLVREGNIDSFTKALVNPSVRQLDCGINIVPTSICPNKFYYACPENLINVEEVPKYAGLIYVSEDSICTIVKKAPQIHKEKLNLDKVLLDKFYYKCLKLENEKSNKDKLHS